MPLLGHGEVNSDVKDKLKQWERKTGRGGTRESYRGTNEDNSGDEGVV